MLQDFFQDLYDGMANMGPQMRRDLTLKGRLEKRFLVKDVAEMFGVSQNYTTQLLHDAAKLDETFPTGEQGARGPVYSLHDIMLMRAYIQSRKTNRNRTYLYWRKQGDPLPVITFGAQKGGTGKSLTAAHFAQYLGMHYGLRVGIIDADPQATISLYFSDETSPLVSGDPNEIATVARFMGVEDSKNLQLDRDTAEMDAMWLETPWPGARLMPATGEIQQGDLSLLGVAAQARMPHRILKNAIDRWDADYGPKTAISDLRCDDGTFDMERYEAALNETLDVIIIDQQPSLTLMQLNGLVAASSVIVPQTMKGFDLATLSAYARTVIDFLEELGGAGVGAGRHIVLPTIVQEVNDRDVQQVAELYYEQENLISQVFYARSDAVANAAEEYKSIYEYIPDTRGKRPSAKAFTTNANAVNDHLVGIIMNGALPTKGYADNFIKQRWG